MLKIGDLIEINGFVGLVVGQGSLFADGPYLNFRPLKTKFICNKKSFEDIKSFLQKIEQDLGGGILLYIEQEFPYFWLRYDEILYDKIGIKVYHGS